MGANMQRQAVRWLIYRKASFSRKTRYGIRSAKDFRCCNLSVQKWPELLNYVTLKKFAFAKGNGALDQIRWLQNRRQKCRNLLQPTSNVLKEIVADKGENIGRWFSMENGRNGILGQIH